MGRLGGERKRACEMRQLVERLSSFVLLLHFFGTVNKPAQFLNLKLLLSTSRLLGCVLHAPVRFQRCYGCYAMHPKKKAQKVKAYEAVACDTHQPTDSLHF